MFIVVVVVVVVAVLGLWHHYLAARFTLPKAHKTGTTIVGVVFKDGIVLGADTRATEGDTVCDKNCEKIHYIAPNVWCCGAGTAADTEAVTAMVARQLELLSLDLGREARVVTAVTKLKRHLFRYQGHVSAALVLGGVDVTGWLSDWLVGWLFVPSFAVSPVAARVTHPRLVVGVEGAVFAWRE